MKTREILGLLVLVAILVGSGPAAAATIYVPDDYATIQAAIDAAAPYDEVVVRAGTYTLTSTVSVNKQNLALRGEGASATIIKVAYGIGYAFSISANGVTMSDFQIEKTDKTGVQNLIFVGADDVTIQDNLIWGKYVLGEGDVSRALEVAYGSSNLTIDGNTIHSLRQPGYLNGSLASPTTGTISNNYVYGTRGWVIAGADMSFTGNTWGSGAQANYLDIAILAETPSGYYPDILAISSANNGAVIEDQRTSPRVLTRVFVDDDAAAGGDGTVTRPYQTIAPAIPRVVTGGTVQVADGLYEEQVEIAKALTLEGGGGGGAIIKSPVTLTKSFTTGAVNKPVVYIHDATGVVVKYLTVDGAGRGNSNYRFVGIAFWNASGTVDHCVVKDIKDTPFSGAQHGVGIYSYSSGITAYSVNVWDCEVYGFQKTGMALNAGDTNPFTVDVRRNTVTGVGATTVTAQNGIQVWADLGTGTVADNVVSGIAYDNTSNPTKWVASSILNYYADLNITGNTITGGHMCVYNIEGAGTISGNTIQVAKVGVAAWGICASDPPTAKPSPFGSADSDGGSGPAMAAMGSAAALSVTASGNSVVFSGPDNTSTYGMEFDAGYSPQGLAVTANNNTVTGFEVGMEYYDCESGCDTGVFTSVVANYNDVAGNTLFGMRSNADYIMVDGRHSWWGHASGPYHATLNPSGTGAPVSDYVTFEPWLNGTNQVSVVPAYGTTNCSTPIYYTFYMTRAGVGPEVRGYDLKFAVDPAVVNVANVTADIVEGDYLEDAGDAAFYAVSYGGGVYGVSSAILGGDVGATGNGDLFTVKFTPVAAGLSDIAVTSFKVRDLDNNPLPASSAGGEVRVDCTAPTMEAIAEAENVCYNHAPSFANFGFDDDINLDKAEYQIDALGWNVIFSGIDAASWDDDGWTLPGFGGLGEGSHIVYFRVKDDAGNWNGEGSPQPNLYSWSFVKDTVAPTAPTGLVALPGHNKVHLTWTNPTGDASWAGVEIRRVPWGDYPQYGTPGPSAPSYPADHTQGTYVTQTALAAYDDLVTPRDIHYYGLFSYDCAGNYSAASTSAQDRSTSYWLGDISPATTGNGDIQLQDLALFSLTFAQVQGGPSWNAEGDFGPTDDHSRFGIPLPDDAVNFEDLMIFAMNYGKVSPLGTSGELLALTDAVPLSDQVSFRLVLLSRGDGKATYAVVMENEAKFLKGFSLKVAYGAGNSLQGVTASRSMTGKASEHFFGVIEPESGVAEICVAALGVNAPFEYTGEVAQIVVREDAEGSVALKTVDLRDLNNNGSEVTLPGSGGETPYVPVTTALLQNHPNPFNPTTTVSYDVAVAGRVEIAIYDVSGALVRTLVSEERPVGRHAVTWDGRDGAGNQVHTGVYFYRMTAPGYASQAKKMLLLK